MLSAVTGGALGGRDASQLISLYGAVVAVLHASVGAQLGANFGAKVALAFEQARKGGQRTAAAAANRYIRIPAVNSLCNPCC